MGDDGLSYSYPKGNITINKNENKLIVDDNGKKFEYSLDSIYRVVLIKSKISLRFLLFGTVIGIAGVLLFVHGLILIFKGGLGETIVGLIFLLLSILSFKVGVIPAYHIGIMSTKENKNIKVKKSLELITFIKNVNSLIKEKHPNSENGTLAGSSNDYFGGKI